MAIPAPTATTSFPSPAVTSSSPTAAPAPPMARSAGKTTATDSGSSTPGTPSKPLSPDALPFHPASAGRGRDARWTDDGDDDLDLVDYEYTPSPSPRSPSYRDVLCGSTCRSPAAHAPLAAAAPVPLVGATVPAVEAAAQATQAAEATALVGTGDARRRRRRRPSRRARIRRAAAAAVLASDHVSAPREARPVHDSRRRPRVDADGFEEVISRSNRRRLRRGTSSSGRSSTSSTERRIPPEMRDRCLKCLSSNHRVATCRLPLRCLRCHGLRHVARDCPRPRSPTPPRPQSRRFERQDGSPTPPGSMAPSCTPSPPVSPRLLEDANLRVSVKDRLGPRPLHRQAAAGRSPTGLQIPNRAPPPAHSPRHPQVAIPIATSTVPCSSTTLQQEPECCYVERSAAMVAEEARLHLALLGMAGNASRDITPAAAAMGIITVTGLHSGDFSLKPFHPENFLVECSSQGARDTILSAGPIPMAGTTMSFRPWKRLANAESETLLSKVTVEIDGIPAHAWDLDTASKLLAPHGWIERVDAASANKTDMSTFRLTAWTKNPAALPTRKKLMIAEPEIPAVYPDRDMQAIFGSLPPYLRQKKMLVYPIDFHLRTIADFGSRSSSPSGPSFPSHDGANGPDRTYGFRQGTAGPRLSSFPRRDGRRHTGGGGGGGGCGNEDYRHATIGCDATKTLHCTAELESTFPKAASDARKPTSETGVQATAGSSLGAEPSDKAASPRAALLSTTADRELSHACPPLARYGAVVHLSTTEQDASICFELLREKADWPVAVWEDPMLHEAEIPRVVNAENRGQLAPVTAVEDTDPAAEDAVPVATVAYSPQDMGLEHAEDTGLKQADEAGNSHQEENIDGLVQLDTTMEASTAQEGIQSSSPPTPGPIHGEVANTMEEAPMENSPAARLKAFTNEVQCKIQTPLMPRPVKARSKAPAVVAASKPELPKRSERLAKHPLANVASSKRAEIVLMQRLGMVPEIAPPSIINEARAAYRKLYGDELEETHFEAVQDLIPALKGACPVQELQA
ncbi:unnamed protein product [Urochloa humidicola]